MARRPCSCAPWISIERLAAWTASRSARAGSTPLTQAARKQPVKVSPAPVVSIGRQVAPAHAAAGCPGAGADAPSAPSVRISRKSSAAASAYGCRSRTSSAVPPREPVAIARHLPVEDHEVEQARTVSPAPLASATPELACVVCVASSRPRSRACGSSSASWADLIALQVQDMPRRRNCILEPAALQVGRRNLQRLVDDRPGTVRLDQDDASRQAGPRSARARGEFDAALGEQRSRPVAVGIVAEDRENVDRDRVGRSETRRGHRHVGGTAAQRLRRCPAPSPGRRGAAAPRRAPCDRRRHSRHRSTAVRSGSVGG